MHISWQTALGVVLTATLAACGGDGDTAASNEATSSGAGGAATVGAGGSSGVGGAGSSGGGGSGMGGMMQFGEPIAAPAESWTWVPFEDAFCGDGSTTGLAINPANNSDLVFIYMMGGGACWDEASCYTNQLAANLESGFGEADLLPLTGSLAAGPLDRSDADNPFQNANYVFIPYCTGDLHVGDAITAHGSNTTHHVGYANMAAFLNRIVPTFPNATKVVLAGGSAGGYGATFNFHRAAQWFAPARVDLLNDSGPLLPIPAAQEAAMRDAWQLDANLPAGCTACGQDLATIYGYLAGAHPESRAALLSYTDDNVIQFYFGLSQVNFGIELQALGQTYFLPNDNWHYFAKDGTGHVLMTPAWAGQTVSGVSLRDWVGDMVSDDPSWASLP